MTMLMISLNALLLLRLFVELYFYSSAYDNHNAGFSEGNKGKLYETYSHSLVIIPFPSLSHSDLRK